MLRKIVIILTEIVNSGKATYQKWQGVNMRNSAFRAESENCCKSFTEASRGYPASAFKMY